MVLKAETMGDHSERRRKEREAGKIRITRDLVEDEQEEESEWEPRRKVLKNPQGSVPRSVFKCTQRFVLIGMVGIHRNDCQKGRKFLLIAP